MSLKTMTIDLHLSQVSVHHAVSKEKRTAQETSEKSWLNTKKNPTAKIQVAAGMP